MTAQRQDAVDPATNLPGGRWGALLLAVVIALCALLGTVWASSAAFEKKADKVEVKSLHEKLQTIEIDVAVIKKDVAENKAAVAAGAK